MANIIKNIKDIYEHYGHKETRLRYHVVLVTKYRRKLFHIENLLKEALNECELRSHLKIHAMGYDKDHIHLLISFPPHYSISQTINRIKQFTTNYLYKRCNDYLRSYYWKTKHTLWSDSYFCSTVGSVSELSVKDYILNRGGIEHTIHPHH